MPKQPKRLSTNEVLRQYSIEGGLVGAMPKDFALLRRIICAFIARIERQNPQAAKVLRFCVEGLARYEGLKCNTPAELETLLKKINHLLALIERGDITRGNHNPETLLLQRQYLEDLLQREAFPFKANSAYAQKAWVISHAKKLLSGLHKFTCLCNYVTSFDHYDAGRRRLKTAPQAALQILAFIHNTTPVSIRNVMKPSRRTTSGRLPRG